MTQQIAQKVVIIGLDGVDWRSLNPLIEAGYLPTLARLVREGAHGRLQSTIRPESSVAWSSFATGVNAGKHGVFGFVRHQPNSYDFHLADSRHIRVPRFWDYLGAAGYRVGLLNIPFTYPPQVVNGFSVGCMLTPGAHVTFTYPPELQERLMAQLPQPFLFDSSDDAEDGQKVPQNVADYTQQQLSAALLLLKQEVWDCFIMVFTGPDRLQHFYWTDFIHAGVPIDPANPLLCHFQQLDQAVEQLLEQLPTDTFVLLMSDHGFNGIGQRFFINHWLQQNGYLTLRRQPEAMGRLTMGLAALKKISWLRWLKQSLLPASWGAAHWQVATATQAIDWSVTQVYYAADGGLRINLQGREPAGIVAPHEYELLRTKLMAELSEVVDSQTGQHPIAQIYRRESLYHGSFLAEAPDLIVEPHRDQTTIAYNYLLDSKLGGEPTLFGDVFPYTGNHASQGILIGWGKGVAAGQQLPLCHLPDIAPTVLAVMGVPIPEAMDGQPILDLFAPDSQPNLAFTAEEHPHSSAMMEPANNPDAAVAERLRNLGYLD